MGRVHWWKPPFYWGCDERKETVYWHVDEFYWPKWDADHSINIEKILKFRRYQEKQKFHNNSPSICRGRRNDDGKIEQPRQSRIFIEFR